MRGAILTVSLPAPHPRNWTGSADDGHVPTHRRVSHRVRVCQADGAPHRRAQRCGSNSTRPCLEPAATTTDPPTAQTSPPRSRAIATTPEDASATNAFGMEAAKQATHHTHLGQMSSRDATSHATPSRVLRRNLTMHMPSANDRCGRPERANQISNARPSPHHGHDGYTWASRSHTR